MVEGAPATKIAAKAKELGMKQAKVSRETGIRKTTVSHHFNGRCKPQIGNLVKYARVFGCSVDELVD